MSAGRLHRSARLGLPLAAHNIARWDGSAWHALSYGTGGEVKAIVRTAAGEIILGGDFSSAGSALSVPAENVARWNGSAWSALGSGVGTESLKKSMP